MKEQQRRMMALNRQKTPLTRNELVELYGRVWNTNEVKDDFDILSFYEFNVIVRKRADGKIGTLEYQDSPRFYYRFI